MQESRHSSVSGNQQRFPIRLPTLRQLGGKHTAVVCQWGDSRVPFFTHTHTRSDSIGHLTVSGRFLSLSSSLSKHCVRILFSDMHITCKHKHTRLSTADLQGAQQRERTCESHLLQVPEEQVVVLVQESCRAEEKNRIEFISSRRDKRETASPVAG